MPSILVVEDNPTTRKMLRLALVTDGYAVVEAADARAALAAAESTLPDLILQDLILPDMDGLELLRRLRALPGGAELPILALSGFLSRLEEAQTDREGFTALVVKPIEPSRLVEAIRAYLPQPRAVGIQERDRAQRYLDTADVILLALDLEGRITLMNRKGCDVLGWAEGELIGRDFIETCVPARIRDETRRKLSDVHAGDDSIVENAIVTSSGDERLIEWRTSFQRDDEGRIDHQTIRRVLTLLPKRPAQVVIVDPNQAGADIRGTLLRIEAFITKGGRVVYLTTHSEALQGALKGWSLHEYILASIIWHEMAHIDGADEIEAQRREEALWTRYVMDERVDPGAESPPAGSSRPHRRRSSCHGRLAGRTYLHGLVGFGVEGVP